MTLSTSSSDLRRLGLIGGVTWHSTADYYRRINEGVMAALGPYRSADLVLQSLDYGVVREASRIGDWRPLSKQVVAAGRSLKAAGAEAIVLCSNSLHALVSQVESETGLPALHIADALADALVGHTRVAFLGTDFTMRSRFYRDRLAVRGIEMVLPPDRAQIDRVIMEELAAGTVREASRQRFVEQIARCEQVTAVVLGCTEIAMLVGPADVDLPCFDTAEIHAAAAVQWTVG